jgi:hypothetical protein
MYTILVRAVQFNTFAAILKRSTLKDMKQACN